ncbi:SpoIIE family protein phosphatase [Pseudonocardia kujensis]|uniref:SpoIIE family protein phosphatase n=1 Tax=Pseudonocardia kujensis TaxID=1128675 RepID=UPI001E6106D8|nr:SpoIIE family protein phosphatase [Pseudonocardia kujensis]MCE0768099.1 SpoIIE family protein phosphatase [Pseudonocardia kujensis]
MTDPFAPIPRSADAGADRREVASVSDCGALCDPQRLAALAETGLDVAPDPVMDALTERVRRRLGVPVALVSLVTPDQQMFPGMTGLPEPWASRRSTPLSHSFCQHVVASAAPLIIEDAREHPLVRTNLAVGELGVVAYAGMPLTDEAGNVLGSLCAIDTRPRRWAPEQIESLADLAQTCSTELRLRLARVDADRERRRRDQVDARLRRSIGHSETLAFASQAFAGTETVDDVRERIGETVRHGLSPAYVGLTVLDDEQRLQRLRDARFPSGDEQYDPWVHYGLDAPLPSASAVRTGRIVHYPDRAAFDTVHPAPVRLLHDKLGLQAVVAAPLPGPEGPIGAVVLGWEQPRPLDADDLVTVTTIAGYAGQALARAQHRQAEQQRVTATRQLLEALQRSLLSSPFEPDHLQLAVRYLPASRDTAIGGDWYDAFMLRDGALCLAIGDVAGHDRSAVVAMGQLRNLLRGIAYSAHDTPSAVLTELDGAITDLAVGTLATSVLARIEQPAQLAARGLRRMRWSNAGHPPPLLIDPDGRPRLLYTPPERLLGLGRSARRTDHALDLEPGATLLLYTDGLVERRDRDVDAGLAWLLDRAAEPAHSTLEELCDGLLAEVTERHDDIAVIAIRAHPEDRPRPPASGPEVLHPAD